jgi:demethoxyubiquinone hydroxylase (CLK1/Coq7/Cat5 family)
MNATNKSKLAATNLVQADSKEAHPASLLARILDIEEIAKEALQKLRDDEVSALKQAEQAAKAALTAPVETIETLSAKLAALTAKQATPTEKQTENPA